MSYLTEEERFLAVTVSKTRYAARAQRGLDFNIDHDDLGKGQPEFWRHEIGHQGLLDEMSWRSGSRPKLIQG